MRAQITNGVNLAFSLLGDLTEKVVFTNVGVSGYDFASGEVTETVSTGVTIPGILEKRYLSSAEPAKERIDFLFRSSEMVDPTVYDIVEFDSKKWVIVSSSNNGFVTSVVVEG